MLKTWFPCRPGVGVWVGVCLCSYPLMLLMTTKPCVLKFQFIQLFSDLYQQHSIHFGGLDKCSYSVVVLLTSFMFMYLLKFPGSNRVPINQQWNRAVCPQAFPDDTLANMVFSALICTDTLSSVHKHIFTTGTCTNTHTGGGGV